jgi:hypothetical protein
MKDDNITDIATYMQLCGAQHNCMYWRIEDGNDMCTPLGGEVLLR